LADNLVAPRREQDERRGPKRWVVVDDQDPCSGVPVGAVSGHACRIGSTEGACNGASPRLSASGTRARRGPVGAARAQDEDRTCRRARSVSGDSSVRSALGHQGQHLPFARCEIAELPCDARPRDQVLREDHDADVGIPPLRAPSRRPREPAARPRRPRRVTARHRSWANATPIEHPTPTLRLPPPTWGKPQNERPASGIDPCPARDHTLIEWGPDLGF